MAQGLGVARFEIIEAEARPLQRLTAFGENRLKGAAGGDLIRA